ncbi:ogr/Delta-like zinc finger family protein [Ignatzschineria rhizosphaerae]|uniref:ogr/Delta-like zinc finger family protein n=1 Tax=Ignatzschineria rhizosphaerae TaxID=2923279 RepID=UPI003D8144AB
MTQTDNRKRFRCNQCGEPIYVRYTKLVSANSRQIVYECRQCNHYLKSIEEIYQIAQFRPITS